MSKSLAPAGVKKAQAKKLYECDLCSEFVVTVIGLKIPDPTSFAECPTSFSYVCSDCYNRFLELRTEIVEDAEKRKKELLKKLDQEGDEYEKMMNIIASGRMTTKRRQELMGILKKLAGDE